MRPVVVEIAARLRRTPAQLSSFAMATPRNKLFGHARPVTRPWHWMKSTR
jgi:hypothetical protein